MKSMLTGMSKEFFIRLTVLIIVVLQIVNELWFPFVFLSCACIELNNMEHFMQLFKEVLIN